MKSFSTSIIINASAETVWAILTDASGWTEWNTTIDRIEGRIDDGEKVTVYTKLSPSRAFPAKVTEFVPLKRMVWSGGMPLGLFKGERTYTLTKLSDESVEFTMREVFTGLLLSLFEKSIPNLQPSFDEFAEGLKKIAESRK